MRNPPRLAVRLLERWLPTKTRDDVIGDLIEEYQEGGRTRLWFWRQAVSLLYAYRSRQEPGRQRRVRASASHLRALPHDLRAGWRATCRKPGFFFVVVALLGLGLGANGVMFHWVETALLRPLPYADAERLVRLYRVKDDARQSLSPPNFFDVRERSKAFIELAAYWSPDVTLTGRGEPEKLLAATVSHTFFEVLGVAPELGRGFTPDDDRPGAPLTAVVGHGLWMRRFGGDPNILGRTLSLNGRETEVIGIAPPGFDFPAEGTELWVPLGLPRTRPDRGGVPYRSFRILNVVGRLEPGVEPDIVRARMQSLARALERAHPESNRRMGLELVGLKEVQVAPFRAHLLLLSGAVGATLLIVCANVGGLLLARTLERRKELALRVSLGASSHRIVRQLVVEAAVLGLAGGSLGLLLTYSGTQVLSAFPLDGFPPPGSTAPNPLVLASFFAVTAIVCIGSSAAPAWLARSEHVADALRSEGRVSGGSPAQIRARRLLIVGEMALALLLLVSAVLLLKSFHALRSVETGFRADEVSYVRIELPFTNYRENHRRASFFETLRRELEGLAGVERASLSLGLPLDARAEFFVARSTFTIEGRPESRPGDKPEAALQVVGPAFFEVLEVPVLRGREFDERDHGASPSVVIVNETMAKRFWPGEDPIGRRLTHDLTLVPDAAANSRRIIGVVSDFRYYRLESPAEPQMFIPHAQTAWPQMHVFLKTSLPLDALGSAIRDRVWRLDDEVPVAELRALSEVTEGVLAGPRRRAAIVTAFAVAAVLLAAVGLYGLMAYSVAARRREMGVRLAFGARPGDVLTLVLREALGLALAGALFGIPLALITARWVSSLLYGVSPSDPASYGAIAGALVVIALASSYLPARRAARVDPVAALRGE